MDLGKIVRKSLKFVKKHRAKFLFAGGVASFGATIVLVAKETPEAKQRLEERAEEFKEMSTPKKIVETVKTTAPVLWPSVVAGTATLACFTGSFKANVADISGLAAACKAEHSRRKLLEEKTKELVGDKKYQKIKDEIGLEETHENPPEDMQIINTGTGNVMFRDSWTGQYFLADREYILNTIHELDSMMRSGYSDFTTLNEVLIDIDPRLKCKVADIMGFTAGMGIRFDMDTSCIAPNGQPCVIIDYDIVVDPRFRD